MKFAVIGTGIMGCGWITQCAMTGHEAVSYTHLTLPTTKAWGGGGGGAGRW